MQRTSKRTLAPRAVSWLCAVYALEMATAELVVLDPRAEAASNETFYREVSDHLPIVVEMRAGGPDDD